MVRLMQHEKMFRYHLKRDVAMLPFKDGNSLLYNALLHLSERKQAIHYVYHLVVNKAAIDSDCQAYMIELAEHSPESYNALTEVVPELRIAE